MPEESANVPGHNDDTMRRLERRVEDLEFATRQENRWWRGGLIAALVLVALSILIAGHHRHHHPPPPMMGMTQGWGGPRMMPYGPPPPPYSGYGPAPGYDGPPEGWRHHQWEGPAPETQPQQPKG
ncbi:MAG TPA: hypothetical protein VN867_00325 [Candidatus Binataceae bacterium]|nr:hypothetical protein [Candidatus Binataceae bacterium]